MVYKCSCGIVDECLAITCRLKSDGGRLNEPQRGWNVVGEDWKGQSDALTKDGAALTLSILKARKQFMPIIGTQKHRQASFLFRGNIDNNMYLRENIELIIFN